MPISRKRARVSVFDAMFGLPIRRPTKKKPAPETPAPDAPATAAPVPEAGAAPAAETETKPDSADPPSDGWTEEQKLTLMQLKDTEGKSWKEICVRMEKFSQKQLKAKYRELKHPKAEEKAAEGAPADAKAEEAKKDEEAKKEESKEEETAESGPVADEVSEAPVINVDPGEDPPDRSAEQSKEGDDEWQPNEVALLIHLAEKYDRYKWLQIASQFYDRTGIRVSAQAVRSKIG